MTGEAATLAIAVVSLVLSALSLGWQAATFVLEGGRIKARFRPGFSNGAGVIHVPPAKFADKATIDLITSQGFTLPVVSVQVRNVGRLPVSIESWSVAAKPGGTAFQPMGQSVGPAFPHRLAAGEAAMWSVEFRTVHALVTTTSSVLKIPVERMRVEATVDLSDGRTIKAKGSF